MFTIFSHGMQICSLSLGILALFLEIAAHAKDMRYEQRDKVTPVHDHVEHSGILMNEEITRKEYFSKTGRNLWYEPMAISFIVVSLGMYSGYVYLAHRSNIIAKSVFLAMVVNGVQIYFFVISALLIMKSYMLYDTGYYDAFVRGIRIHYFGLAKDGYMRLHCYDGFFRQDVRNDHHFDEKKFTAAVSSSSIFRSRYAICQQTGLKISAMVLLLISALFCAYAQWFSFCLEISVSYDPVAKKTNKVFPQFTFNKVDGIFKKEGIEMKQNIKSAKNETNIDYLEENEEIEFSIATDDDIFQFDVADRGKSSKSTV